MRFASLGSGSRGNALVVDAGDTRILLDCGFSLRTTLARLNRLGVEAETIKAVLVTHEHSDHASGVFRFAARFGIPVFLTHGTQQMLPEGETLVSCHVIDAAQSFVVGALEVQAFPVPHDAREPVQYVFSDGKHRLGVLTDCGVVSAHVRLMLNACDALVLECNHDPHMLAVSGYPASLKQRVSGNFGHLSNEQAAGLLTQIDTRALQHIVAAHLSEKNNRPELAVAALASVLDCRAEWITVASQEAGFDWRQLC